MTTVSDEFPVRAEHDYIEKIVSAMLKLKDQCHTQFKQKVKFHYTVSPNKHGNLVTIFYLSNIFNKFRCYFIGTHCIFVLYLLSYFIFCGYIKVWENILLSCF